LTFAPDELAAIEGWTNRARPLAGVFYRSVEYRFMDPSDVLSGKGTEMYGGRFAEVGTRAVYLAGSDDTATREALARKRRLGNNAQITLDKYPRVVFAVAVSVSRVVTWLRRPRSRTMMQIRNACLSQDDLARSQELGELLRRAGVQGLLFPSVVGAGRNLIVYLDNCDTSSLKLQNADEMQTRIADIAKLRKARARPQGH
jgi:RES domain-containing protein